MKVMEKLKTEKDTLEFITEIYNKSFYSEFNRYLSKLIIDKQGLSIPVNNILYTFEDNKLKITIDCNTELTNRDINKKEFIKIIKNIEGE